MKSIFTSAIIETKKIHASIENRVDFREFRSAILHSISIPIVKIAFDTRRINQGLDINPRRNLQYYHRSESFITKDSSNKIKTLFKIKSAVDAIKENFLGEPEWLDSYCRILSATVDRTLRIDQKDMDFFKPQIDYLQELLYLRYRLKEDDIVRLNEKEIQNIILDKDEKLLYKQIYGNYNINGISKQSDGKYNLVSGKDGLIDTLFNNVKASKENKEVQRSVTITINDKIVDEKKE